MKKLLFCLLLLAAPFAWAGLGDPMTYTLPTPPSPDIPPTPYSLPVPPRPTTAQSVDLPENQTLNIQMDRLRMGATPKVRVQHAPGMDNQPVLCHVKMKNLCQGNSIHVLTDQGALTKSPLERQNPNSYVSVSGFTDYFDMRIQGNTSCKLDINCSYIQTP
jgi:hypothetical protein